MTEASILLKNSPQVGESEANSRWMLWAVVLSIMLVGARAMALSTGSNSTLQLVWGVTVGLVSFISPLSGVALSLGNIFISLNDDLPIGLSVGQIAGLSAVSRMFLQITTRRIQLPFTWRPSLVSFAGIAFVIMLSALASPFSSLPTDAMRKLSLIVLLYLLTVGYVNTRNKLLFIQITMVCCAGLAGAWAIGQSLDSSSFQERAAGLVGNPNYQGIYCAIATPLVIGLVAYVKSLRWRLLVILSGIAIVGGVVATASRGGLIVLGISLLVSTIVWGRSRPRIQLLLSIIIAILVIMLTQNDVAQGRLDEAFTTLITGTAESTSRAQLADDSLSVWSRYPVLGVGAGNWLSGVNQLRIRASNVTSPHVWPAQILAELGTLGFGCYLAFVLFCVQEYRTTIKHFDKRSAPDADILRGFLAATIAMSLAWTSGNPYNQLWFELLLIGSVCRITFAAPSFASDSTNHPSKSNYPRFVDVSSNES